MAKREPNVEYITKKVKGHGGKVTEIETMDAKLYAPDGSIFCMPFGGSVLNYVSKGYKLKPDAEWNEANAKYEQVKAESLKLSNFQREVEGRRLEVERKREHDRMMAEMESINAELEAEEAKLRGDSEPAKPKAKAKAKAKANPLSGE